MLSPFRMVCHDFILPEDCKPCLFLSAFHFAKLIVPYRPPFCPPPSGRRPCKTFSFLSPSLIRWIQQKAPPRLVGREGPCIAMLPQRGQNHSMILLTTPEPTVRPPSRIAKRRPSSIATAVSSSTVMTTLSPGMHISVPSGRLMMPVTSVVRK